MTITIAYLRRRKQTVELVMASDSRLRMRTYGPSAEALSFSERRLLSRFLR